ncbi:MAG: heparinase II/III-family protein, partial [Armatimonadota bacterium]
YLLFDAGPMYSHTHQDALAFQMYAYGDTLIWDGGTCNYNLPEDRAYYRQARAHSLVMIDDLDLQLDDKPVVHHWLSEETFDFVDGEAGYTNVPVRHRRQILFVKPDYWILRDVLSGRGAHHFEQQFHLGVDSQPQMESDSRAIVTQKAQGPNVWLACVAPSQAVAELVPGLISYNHGTPGVTSNLEAPVASFRFEGDCDAGPITFLTIVVPLREGASSPAIETLPPPAPGAVAFRVTTAAGTDDVVVAGEAPVTLGALTLRNQIGVLRAGEASRVITVSAD